MDQRLVAQLSGMKYAAALAAVEDKPEPHDINYHKIQQYSEQLAVCAKQAQTSYVALEEMERLCQLGEGLQKELQYVRSDLIRRKNLELLLPSPNTQHHLPCSSLLSPTSTPSSPTSQQNIAMSTGASTSSNNLSSSPSTTPNGSPSSPHNMNESSMSITTTGVMQSDDYWRNRKIDPTKIVRRSPTPLYVNLTEQMILAQSSKRKRPAEGDLYCHNCKTKDTPEWRRGPMGAKTLCNACGIRWRLSQAEAAKQKKGGIDSPPLTPSLQFPHIHPLPPSPPQQHSSPSSQQSSPTQQMVQQTLLQQQHQQIRQLQQLQHLQQQPHQASPQQSQQQSMQLQYAQSPHQHQHPQQQHMVLPGHVGLAQENTPAHMDSSSTGLRNTTQNNVLSPLSMAPSPIAT